MIRLLHHRRALGVNLTPQFGSAIEMYPAHFRQVFSLVLPCSSGTVPSIEKKRRQRPFSTGHRLRNLCSLSVSGSTNTTLYTAWCTDAKEWVTKRKICSSTSKSHTWKVKTTPGSYLSLHTDGTGTDSGREQKLGLFRRFLWALAFTLPCLFCKSFLASGMLFMRESNVDRWNPESYDIDHRF